MTNVYLYGQLRNKFGHEFKFHIESPKEALRAINANKRGFLEELKKLAVKGFHYRVIVDDQIIVNAKELEVKKIPKEVHIVPIVWGAGVESAIWFVEAVLATFEIYGAVGTFIATAVVYTAVAVAVYGVSSLLFPDPKPDFNQEVQAGAKSYLFGNKPNNTAQGQAVPVGYGRLKIGGSQISAGATHHPLSIDVKQLMTPVDKPIDDYTSLEFDNEVPDSTDGLLQNSFSTNQAVDMSDTVSFASATILNSYVDIVTKNAYKVTSGPVEVVVVRDGEIISNVNLDTYDEDIEYEWSVISQSRTENPIKIEYPYAFESGLVFRSYFPLDYRLTTNYENIRSTGDGFFVKYNSGDLVRFGPNQFNRLPIGDWDYSYRYYSGEIVKYPTGQETDVYFQALVTGTGGLQLGFDGTNTDVPTNPTGIGGGIRSAYWRKILPPIEEKIYRAESSFTGHLPSTGTNTGNLPFWTGLSSPKTKTEFDQLISGMPFFSNEGIYQGVIENTNQQAILGSRSNDDNYTMEFLGYFYVPLVDNLKKQVPDTTAGVMYEIVKVGNTGQWSGIGLTGAGGVAIPPKRGLTFVKNSTQSAGDGVCYPVVKYKFKLDSDSASDLYIDGQAASVWYSGHGFADPTTSAEVASMPSSSEEILLTAGYHNLYARFQDGAGRDGISFYYQYDTNWDGGYSDFATIPANRLKYRAISDVNILKTEKFLPRSYPIPATSMVSGKQYKIINLGSVTNWGSLGASSPRVGTVFTKINNTAPNTSDAYVFEDLYNYAESRSSEGNRIVQFSAMRPRLPGPNGVINFNAGYSSYEAKFNCKTTLEGVTLTTAPVRIKIKFLESNYALQNVKDNAINVYSFPSAGYGRLT